MTVPTFQAAIAAGCATTAEALAIFDSLEPVEIDFILGAWAGAGFPTDHSLDGVLEAYHWQGKRFESAESVHPLVFRTLRGGTTYVDPRRTMPSLDRMLRLPFFKSPAMGRLFQVTLPFVSTRKSRARLRMTSHRGKTSATMIYDHLPVHDVFRKVDADTVLGLMDRKGTERPFFFVLRRER